MKLMFENFPGLKPALNKEWFDALGNFIAEERKTKQVIPERDCVFKAFHFFNEKNLRVVFLGQDVYPNKDHATGLAFGIPFHCSAPAPYSLNIIYKELSRAYSTEIHDARKLYLWLNDWTLESWAKQGVLLLNTALTTIDKKVGAHLQYWKTFTTTVLEYIQSLPQEIIFVFVGSVAKQFSHLIKNVPTKNIILKVPHPACSAYNSLQTFIGTDIFKTINTHLKDFKSPAVDWLGINL